MFLKRPEGISIWNSSYTHITKSHLRIAWLQLLNHFSILYRALCKISKWLQWQLKWILWMNEILWDLSLGCVLMAKLHCTSPQTTASLLPCPARHENLSGLAYPGMQCHHALWVWPYEPSGFKLETTRFPTSKALRGPEFGAPGPWKSNWALIKFYQNIREYVMCFYGGTFKNFLGTLEILQGHGPWKKIFTKSFATSQCCLW